MTKAVARSADGLLAHPFSSPKYLKKVKLPNIEEGLQTLGKRGRLEFDLSNFHYDWNRSKEESHKKAVRACRDQVAF
ncbi:MAG: hypothetical protein Ct9H90mP13_01920 [Pseudomonadota bacterium]|nr:MAG: hypothetical protein Ct9H90mP13_01920 [Pseudomonadota bacterium]